MGGGPARERGGVEKRAMPGAGGERGQVMGVIGQMEGRGAVSEPAGAPSRADPPTFPPSVGLSSFRPRCSSPFASFSVSLSASMSLCLPASHYYSSEPPVKCSHTACAPAVPRAIVHYKHPRIQIQDVLPSVVWLRACSSRAKLADTLSPLPREPSTNNMPTPRDDQNQIAGGAGRMFPGKGGRR